MSSKILRSTTLAIAGLFATLPLAAEPVAVSPGGVSDFTALAGSCPSFDWSGVTDDEPVDLAIYRVDQAGDFEPVLVQSLPAGARGWSPAADQCLATGGRYAWMVREHSADEAGEWSEARLFEVRGLPSDEEVLQALETLRRYREGREGDSGDDPSRTGREGDVGEGLTPSGSPGASLPTGETSGTEARRYRVGEQALSAPTVSNTPSPQVVTPPASFSLNLSGDLSLGPAGKVFLSQIPFIHNDKGAGSTAVGWDALVSATPGMPTAYDGIRNSALGHRALTASTEGAFDTAVGYGALQANTTGDYNTAVGAYALTSNTEGNANTALGRRALEFNLTGAANTALGDRALRNNTSTRNSAVGARALFANTSGNYNTAVGFSALTANTGGDRNVALGTKALEGSTIGSDNVAIGHRAGQAWTNGHANIAIGSGVYGVAGESNTTRIGGSSQSHVFIEGIRDTTTDVNDAITVMIDSDGQLGTISSSARFKEDIHDLRSLSARLNDLRPVAFRYRKPFAGGAKPIQFGLIAEEVAEAFPELVVYDEEGRPETVKYHLLSTLLLNEVQRQQDELEALRREVAKLVDERRFRR